MLLGDILEKYQTLTGKEYPSLEQFVAKAQEVADRINRRNRNKQKDDNSNNSQKPDASITSTIPASVSTVNSRATHKQKKTCMFCEAQNHISSRCPKFITVKAREAAVKTLKGIEPCNKCLIIHAQKSKCMDCCHKSCTSKDTHGVLACPLILAQLAQKTIN